MMKKGFTKQDFYALLKAGGPNGDCLEWTGPKNKQGYGQTYSNGKPSYKTHRISLELEGIDTTGWYVLHSCDNPSCCNPAHLRLGTPKDNVHDRDNRKRGKIPDNRGSNCGNSKLVEYQVIDIKHRLSLGHSHRDIANHYGVAASNISAIATGRSWKHI